MKIARVLISVSDKTHLAKVALALKGYGAELIASTGSAAFLHSKGLAVTPLEEVTGNAEAFQGRLKTISFALAGGILFRRDDKRDRLEAEERGIKPIDLIICNLYPFMQMQKVENIDIGGVLLLRAGAKNYQSVGVLSSPEQYGEFIANLQRGKGSLKLEYRQQLAQEAFRLTATYDGAIATHLAGVDGATGLDDIALPNLNLFTKRTLRYGENPQQRGWVAYRGGQNTLASATPLQGKELSWNNLLDGDGAFKSCGDMDSLRLAPHSVSVVKHGSICGGAMALEQHQALEWAWQGDEVSAFGSIICFNETVTRESGSWLNDKFVEVIIAPDFSPESLEIFGRKKNLRLIPLPVSLGKTVKELSIRTIDGGFLLQEEDGLEGSSFRVVTQRAFEEDKKELAIFGEIMVKHIKSNAAAIVTRRGRGYQLIGTGTGWPNRLGCIEAAISSATGKLKNNLEDCVWFPTLFCPFLIIFTPLPEGGLEYIVQPGGSRKDQEVIDTCNSYSMAMALTGRRHFRH